MSRCGRPPGSPGPAQPVAFFRAWCGSRAPPPGVASCSAFGRGVTEGWADGVDRTPAEPETSPTLGARSSARSLDSGRQVGCWGVRAAGSAARPELRQAYRWTLVLAVWLLWGRALCPARRWACRRPGDERLLGSLGLWAGEVQAFRAPQSRARSVWLFIASHTRAPAGAARILAVVGFLLAATLASVPWLFKLPFSARLWRRGL